MKWQFRSTLTTYKLLFLPSARKEWDKIGDDIRDQFRRKLGEHLIAPHVPTARLSGMPNCYKIKLRAAGYRLVYRVDDGRVIVTVIAVGRRERNAVYRTAAGRIDK